MALDLNYYRAIQHSLNMPSPSETRRREARRKVSRDYYHSLDVDKFLLFEAGLTDTEYFLNPYDRKYSHYNGVEQKFTCPLDANLEAGDLVYNPKQDEYWVTITSHPTDYIYRAGTMFLCDTTIKWEDDNGKVWEYPVSDNNATQYNSGIFQGRQLDYVTSQHKLTTTADANICALKIDTRFFLGKGTAVPEVYRLTQIDTTSLGYGKGLAVLTLLRATYNPDTDDIETGICRLKEDADNTPSEHSGNITISFNGKPQLFIGSTKDISSDVTSCTWYILEAEAAAIINIQSTGKNTARLSVDISDDAMAFVGNLFTVVCTDDNGKVGTRTFQILGGA